MFHSSDVAAQWKRCAVALTTWLLLFAATGCDRGPNSATSELQDAPQAALKQTGASALAPTSLSELGDPRPATLPRGQIDLLVVGGGSRPADNQLSIEADLIAATALLGGAKSAIQLVAGGAGSAGVQVADDAPRSDPLRAQLADLFDPRPGRDAHYRRVAGGADGPADRATFLAALEQGLAAKTVAPLTVYFAGHGEPGGAPAEVRVALWGGEGFSVTELAAEIERSDSSRPQRWVMTSCFAGGFAELMFAGGDGSEVAIPLRCGLFASTWDRPASGCDPNPDRRAHEGYGVRLLAALARPKGADLDGDGRVSLLEAHARASVAGMGIDVPTTTSERWLRLRAPREGPSATPSLPEWEVIRDGLSSALGLENPGALAARLAALETKQESYEARALELALAESETATAAGIALLSRWPVLNDPWHPDFAPMLADPLVRRGLGEWLSTSSAYAHYLQARAALFDASAAQDRVMLAQARSMRLARAWETLALAGRLKAQGGPDWDTYQALLACERHRDLPPEGTP